MAHWIIEDHGFGGQYYRCSECRESWCDIFKDVSREEKCPNCGATINEDETEYIEEKKPTIFGVPTLSKSTVRASLQAYCELETKLIQLTGFNLEKLVELFAAGYELRPPEYKSLNDVLRDITR